MASAEPNQVLSGRDYSSIDYMTGQDGGKLLEDAKKSILNIYGFPLNLRSGL
jgi:hypothetical protein